MKPVNQDQQSKLMRGGKPRTQAAALIACLASAFVVGCWGNEGNEQASSDELGLQTAAPTPAYGFKPFRCDLNGDRESYVVEGEWMIHPVGGQYEVKGGQVRLTVKESGSSPAAQTTSASGQNPLVVQMQPHDNQPIIGSGPQAHFWGRKDNFVVNIHINTARAGETSTIIGDVEHQFFDGKTRNIRLRNNCNFESAIAPASKTPSAFRCTTAAPARVGGHSYTLHLKAHPRQLAGLSTTVSHQLDVTGKTKIYPIALSYERAESSAQTGPVTLQDATNRLSVRFYNLAGMGSDRFQASLTHRIYPASGADGFAREIMTCQRQTR